MGVERYSVAGEDLYSLESKTYRELHVDGCVLLVVVMPDQAMYAFI